MGFFQPEEIQGTDKANTIVAGRCPFKILGRGGDDLLIGGPCRDMIKGGSGNDTIKGRGNNDLLIGGSGDDRIYGGRADQESLGQGDTIYAGKGADFVRIGGRGSLLPWLGALADGDADTVIYKLNKGRDSLLQFASENYDDLLDESDRIIVQGVRTDQLEVRLGESGGFDPLPAGVFLKDRIIISFVTNDIGIPLEQLSRQIVGSLG
ncbi:MAG: calcium-binding protein [Prochlorococcaceae cyanobacterium]